MRKLTTTLFIGLSALITTNAQTIQKSHAVEKTASTSSVQKESSSASSTVVLKKPTRTNTASKAATSPQTLSNKSTNAVPVKNKAYYDSFIQAIETKMAHIRSNPEAKKKAEAGGWFDQMEKELTQAKKERDQLTNTTK